MGRHKKIKEEGTPPFAPDGSIMTQNPGDDEEIIESIVESPSPNPQDTDPPVAGREIEDVHTPLRPAPVRAQTEDYDELIETRLSQDIEQENSIKTVSKELFSKDSIEMKTEITHDEINDITRLEFLAAKFGISNVDVLKSSFLRLRVSKNRKSRGEFIASLQTENRNNNPAGGFLSKMFGGLGGGGGNQ